MAAAYQAPGRGRLEWTLVAAALSIAYAPTFANLAASYWRTDEGAHGPLILAIVLWLFWRRREALFAPPRTVAPVIGIATVSFGLFLYVLGRSFEIALFEILGLVPVVGGTLVAMRGWAALRALWFPVLFVLFMIPLPGIFVDALTGPLKAQVSQIAEAMLYAAGYPVGRSGVLLMVGPYQLLVADACAGMNSMFSLAALGVLYMHLKSRPGIAHNSAMLLSIVPIAFAANVARVVLLMLITYHLGDEAGQGFLHGATGIVLLLVAVAGFITLDAALAVALRRAR